MALKLDHREHFPHMRHRNYILFVRSQHLRAKGAEGSLVCMLTKIYRIYSRTEEFITEVQGCTHRALNEDTGRM